MYLHGNCSRVLRIFGVPQLAPGLRTALRWKVAPTGQPRGGNGLSATGESPDFGVMVNLS